MEIAWVIFLIPIAWGLYRLVIEGEPGKPSLMEMERERHELEMKEMKRRREMAEFEARAVFQVLANRYRSGEVTWDEVMAVMWLNHPHEMQRWQEEWNRQQTMQ